jgi:hypothetical protein
LRFAPLDRCDRNINQPSGIDLKLIQILNYFFFFSFIKKHTVSWTFMYSKFEVIEDKSFRELLLHCPTISAEAAPRTLQCFELTNVPRVLLSVITLTKIDQKLLASSKSKVAVL